MMMISNICNMQYQKGNLWTQHYMISWCCTSSIFILHSKPNEAFSFWDGCLNGGMREFCGIWGNKGAFDQRRWRWFHGCLHSEEARLEKGSWSTWTFLLINAMLMILPSVILENFLTEVKTSLLDTFSGCPGEVLHQIGGSHVQTDNSVGESLAFAGRDNDLSHLLFRRTGYFHGNICEGVGLDIN